MTIMERSRRSIRWNLVVSGIQVSTGVVRYILLARWIPPTVFGVYAFATALIGISILFTEWGMTDAYLHRSAEMVNEPQALAVLFTIRVLLTTLWVLVLLSGAWMLTSGSEQLAVVVLTLAHAVNQPLLQTPKALLTRRIVHRRLALHQSMSTILASAVALGLAWQGAGLWSLLATDIVNATVTVAVLYVWRPVWRPRFAWDPSIVRYYMSFGGRAGLAALLLRFTEEIDDLWTKANLGTTALGFYARAFQFASYPRLLLATPLSSVADGLYSALKDDRAALSRSFLQLNSRVMEIGFLVAGTLAIAAPNVISLLLGATWMSIVPTFQLMLVYALLDPIRATMASVLIAVGRPDRLIQVRLVQCAALLVGLVTLGPRWHIEGVAVAVDITVVIAMVTLLWHIRDYVDVSVLQLFRLPGIALTLGLIAAWGTLPLGGNGMWWTSGAPLLSFIAVYTGCFAFVRIVEQRGARVL